jgi:hypothetical protein
VRTNQKRYEFAKFCCPISDEVSRRVKFKEYRDNDGGICPHCGGIDRYLETR